MDNDEEEESLGWKSKKKKTNKMKLIREIVVENEEK